MRQNTHIIAAPPAITHDDIILKYPEPVGHSEAVLADLLPELNLPEQLSLCVKYAELMGLFIAASRLRQHKKLLAQRRPVSLNNAPLGPILSGGHHGHIGVDLAAAIIGKIYGFVIRIDRK